MSIFEIIFISISLATDAFTVSLSNGIALKKVNLTNSLKFGIFFGFFQFIMPIIGYYFTILLGTNILKYNYLIAFLLLNAIGINMILETFKKFNPSKLNSDKKILSIKNLIILSIATSIDALALGVSFYFIKINIVPPSITIGFITFIFSFLGVLLGKKIGNIFSKNAERIGGIILMLIGFKFFIEHFIK